jgi:hypothetical protein
MFVELFGTRQQRIMYREEVGIMLTDVRLGDGHDAGVRVEKKERQRHGS